MQCEGSEPPAAVATPRLYCPPRRSAEPVLQQPTLASNDYEPTNTLGMPPVGSLLALTKEALERNARKAGPRPDLQRRVSRFLEEISEAEELLDDPTLSQDGGPDRAIRDETPGEARIPAPTHAYQIMRAATSLVEHASGPPTAALPSFATDPPRSDRPAPAEAEVPPPQPLAAARLTVAATATTAPPKLVDRSRNESQLNHRAAPDDKGGPMPAKKACRILAPFATADTAVSARPRGKENGAAQGGVAAELEKQLQARLEWSERQKRREEEAKRFRQRQRDEEAVSNHLATGVPGATLCQVLY